MHRPTSGRAGSLAFNVGMHIYKARTREVAPLRPGNRSPAKKRRERREKNEKEEKEETIKIGEWGRLDPTTTTTTTTTRTRTRELPRHGELTSCIFTLG